MFCARKTPHWCAGLHMFPTLPYVCVCVCVCVLVCVCVCLSVCVCVCVGRGSPIRPPSPPSLSPPLKRHRGPIVPKEGKSLCFKGQRLKKDWNEQLALFLPLSLSLPPHSLIPPSPLPLPSSSEPLSFHPSPFLPPSLPPPSLPLSLPPPLPHSHSS